MNQENNYPEHNCNMLHNPLNVFRNPAEQMFSSKIEDSRKPKEEIKTTEESTKNISGYGKNKRRMPVDQFQVPYYSNFIPHDYVTSESFRLQDMMCNLLKRQSVPDIDIDEFDGNAINYHYFIALFKEVVQSKIDDPRGCLARLIKYTKSGAKELIKHCIQHPPELGYHNALTLLEKQYGDPLRIMSSYRKKIKLWPEVRTGDTAGYSNYYNFLLKCQSNLDSPEVLYLLISKFPCYVRER